MNYSDVSQIKLILVYWCKKESCVHNKHVHLPCTWNKGHEVRMTFHCSPGSPLHIKIQENCPSVV